MNPIDEGENQMIWLSALFKVLLATQPWLAFIIVLVFDIPRDTLSFVITGSHRLGLRYTRMSDDTFTRAAQNAGC